MKPGHALTNRITAGETAENIYKNNTTCIQGKAQYVKTHYVEEDINPKLKITRGNVSTLTILILTLKKDSVNLSGVYTCHKSDTICIQFTLNSRNYVFSSAGLLR